MKASGGISVLWCFIGLGGFACRDGARAPTSATPAQPDGGADTAGSGTGLYVPDVVVPYDGRYLDGSFERNLGFGYDRCATHTAGLVESVVGEASVGSQYLVFSSSPAATFPGGVSESQIYLWFNEVPNPGASMGLYFDVQNLDLNGPAGTLPTGTLNVYSTDSACESEILLASIRLEDLQVDTNWSTRCVTLSRPGSQTGVGMAMTAGLYKLGVDGMRLGPPCHGSKSPPL